MCRAFPVVTQDMRAPGAAVKDWNDSKLYCGCVCACLGPCVLRSPHAALAVAKGAVPRSIHGPRLLLPWVLRLGVSMCLVCPCFGRCPSGYPRASFAFALVGAHRGIHAPHLPMLWSARIAASARFAAPRLPEPRTAPFRAARCPVAQLSHRPVARLLRCPVAHGRALRRHHRRYPPLFAKTGPLRHHPSPRPSSSASRLWTSPMLTMAATGWP